MFFGMNRVVVLLLVSASLNFVAHRVWTTNCPPPAVTQSATQFGLFCLDHIVPIYWQPPYFLVSHLYVRIYEEDKAQLRWKDLLHWLTYMKYAGVQHIYLYDCWHKESEILSQKLQSIIDTGYVTYVSWNDQERSLHGSSHMDRVEIPARSHCLQYYGHEFIWMTHLDMDEYPFAENDTRPGFLQRFVEAKTALDPPDHTEYTLENFLMLGYRNSDSPYSMLIRDITRRTKEPANFLVKPIVRRDAIQIPTVHHNTLQRGISINVPPSELRMNHFWGARLQNWSEEIPREWMDKTIEDVSMLPIAQQIEDCF